MPHYKMKIAYDGTNYCGWQVQENGTSIQAIIQQALSTILRTQTDLTGSGRTDAGVHAKAQVAHFKAENMPSAYSLNALLPADIRVLEVHETSSDFHARYSATGKIYAYHLHLNPIRDPFKRGTSYHVYHQVDLSMLREASQYFIGTHDFTSFANEANTGSAAKDAIRTIYRLDIIEEEGGVRIEIEGDGFLYKMVRNIVGTLLDVCAGKIPMNKLPEIIAAKDRKRGGKAAPPHGLFLMEVKYDECPRTNRSEALPDLSMLSHDSCEPDR